MGEFDNRLDKLARAENNRRKTKAITTARMWNERADGSAEAPSSSMSGIYDAIREAGIFGYEKNFEIF